jgi:hypothetical protein
VVEQADTSIKIQAPIPGSSLLRLNEFTFICFLACLRPFYQAAGLYAPNPAKKDQPSKELVFLQDKSEIYQSQFNSTPA